MGPSPGRGVSGNMRRLFVVGYSADHKGIVLATRKGAKSGSYLLEVDEAVLDVIEAAGRRRPIGAPASTRTGTRSELSPREIQAQLRAGHPLEAVAAQAGVGVDWIERFASPVMAELASAISRASQTVLHTAERGLSDRPLEASVLRNLASRGVVLDEQEFQSAWSARHLVDAEWCVAFRFRNRGRDVVAEWGFNAHTGALNARNRMGEELGYVGLTTEHTPAGTPSRPARRAGASAGTPTGDRAAPAEADRTPGGAAPADVDMAETAPAEADIAGAAPADAISGETRPAAAAPGQVEPAAAGPGQVEPAAAGPGQVEPVAAVPGGDAPAQPTRTGAKPAADGVEEDGQPRLPLAGLPQPVSPPAAGNQD